MKISSRKLNFVNFVFLGSTLFGLAGFAAHAGAQDVGTPALNQSVSLTDPSTQRADSSPDKKLLKRVKDALHSDPYFYDEHVTVSVENGAVVLHGFVSSEWDLRDAIRVASKAAGGVRVVDNLSVKLGGSH